MPYVYGIQSGLFIKIGVATDVNARLRTMNLYNPHPCKIVARRYTMQELIERLEKATGPDRDLDALISVATFDAVRTDDDLIYARPRERDGSDATHPGHYFIKSRSGAQAVCSPAYTASIDAALTLVPEGYASAVGTMAFKDSDKKPWACYWTPDGSPHSTEGNTPAIALCIAALKARQAIEAKGEG